MKNKAKLVIVTVILIISIFPLAARADTGPKPYIVVYCSNLPAGDVYIDLLIDDPLFGENEGGFYYGDMNHHGQVHKDFEPPEYYESGIIEILENYNEDGWRPTLVTGTNTPLWAELMQTVDYDGEASSQFDYFGVPQRFKVIIVTGDGDVTVTNVIEKKSFKTVIDIDYLTKKSDAVSYENIYDGNGNFINENSYYTINVNERNPFVQTLIQFALTLSSTYIIEGLVLLLFRFSLKQNWKPFVFVNLGTQIALNLLVALANLFVGTAFALIAYFLFEVVIFTVESGLYTVLLKQHSKSRRAVYAITANAASFAAGLFLLGQLVF